MSFLAPYWLLAASAILVPIAIHLWNKRQGKTVKVGSLRWLEASASKRWSSIKLNDVWLLLLRCVILILLAVALAKPVWERAPQKQQGKKAVYVGQELLYSTALKSIKPTIDSLLLRGYTLHNYSPGFKQVTQEQWQKLSSTANDSLVSSGNYWALLPALAQRHPQQQDSVWLFTSDQQRHFKGAPTVLQENITWIPVALEASTNWLQAANIISPDSIQFILGNSTREGTTYSRTTAAFTGAGQTVKLANSQSIQLTQQGDALWANLQGQKVLVRKEPLQVRIVADKAQQPEVKYLKTAIQAISSYTGLPISTKTLDTSTAPDTSINWVLWLSSEKLQEVWLEQAQEKGLDIWLQSATEPKTTTAHFTSVGGEIRINQLTADTLAGNYTSLWQTSTGESLLSVQPTGKGNIYHFRSRFSPSWSQLGQSAQLPELLLPLLLPQPASSDYDVRAIPEEQLKPAIQPIQAKAKQAAQSYNLMPWLVLAAFILFLAERLITGKRTKV